MDDNNDTQLLASVMAGNLLAFRASQFPSAFVNAHPSIFLSTDWVHPAQLQVFLSGRDMPFSTRPSVVPVKLEASQASFSTRPEEPRVKTEDPGGCTIDLTSPARPLMPLTTVRTCQLVENHSEIIEILSSDDEMEVEASLQPSGASSDPPEPPYSFGHDDSDDEPDTSASVSLSTTYWGDANIISTAIDSLATINQQTRVDRVEYLDQIPSFFPVPCRKTAYILDLRNDEFDFVDKDGNPIRADTLILNKNQESFDTSGSSDQITTCALFEGRPVQCYHTCHKCKGVYRCSELDMSLVNVTHFELDPASRADVISAEIATRMSSRDTPEKLAAAFFRVITSAAWKCKVTDTVGAPCEGHPVMKVQINGALRKGSFIGCSEWTPSWHSHRSDTIPDNIDETLLTQLMSPQAVFTSRSKTEPCSRIISPCIGLRQQFCAHIHLVDGRLFEAPYSSHAYPGENVPGHR
ncbi:hypothetical protein DFH08DRAFT_827167 [Mycena albidolilacea]|uniref:Uncharacterized protein n=1 Tax=Mycena albidolilacea TaxID=1033008 RepID=A0AAD6YYS9_9AGAR|nr:hypothetical protein DFH08DRAFT_827167 [Mycena albidolilacea]